MSPERINMTKIGKESDQLQPIRRWSKQSWWTLVHWQKKL